MLKYMKYILIEDFIIRWKIINHPALQPPILIHQLPSFKHPSLLKNFPKSSTKKKLKTKNFLMKAKSPTKPAIKSPKWLNIMPKPTYSIPHQC